MLSVVLAGYVAISRQVLPLARALTKFDQRSSLHRNICTPTVPIILNVICACCSLMMMMSRYLVQVGLVYASSCGRAAHPTRSLFPRPSTPAEQVHHRYSVQFHSCWESFVNPSSYSRLALCCRTLTIEHSHLPVPTFIHCHHCHHNCGVA